MAEPKFSAPFPLTSTLDHSYAARFPSFLAPVGNALDRLHAVRERLNLPDPGKSEDLGKEVKMTHLSLYTFDGARADLTKTLSQMPAFQVTHSFSAGAQSQQGTAPGTYSFGAVYGDASTLLQGNVDNDKNVTGRLNHAWSASDVSKVAIQLAASPASPQMLSLEHDRSGKDYSLSFKAYNPSPVDLTGNYLLSYMQSVTPHVALGVDALYQRPSPQIEECALGYNVKIHSTAKDVQTGQFANGSWIATGQISPQGYLQGSFWKKLAERVDAGADVMLVPSIEPRQRKAITTLGVKYEFRTATFRGQIDSDGKISTLLEQRLSPAFAFLVSGEMDHKLNKSKFGVGIMVESATEEAMEQAQPQSVAPPM